MKQYKNPVLVAFLNLLSIKFKSLSFFNLKLKSLRCKRYSEAVIISIDNLSFGGTGKTPLIIETGRSLQEAGIQFAIVSRGYKAQYEQAGVLVEPGFTAAQVGDEAKLLKTRFPGTDILIGRDRHRSIKKAVERGNRVIILDDGFQSTDIYRDVKIMLFNPFQPYYYLRNFKFLMKEEDYVFYFVPGPAAQGAHKGLPVETGKPGGSRYRLNRLLKLVACRPQNAARGAHKVRSSRQEGVSLSKSFLGGQGGRFFKKAPLAAGGKEAVNRKPLIGAYYFAIENFYDAAEKAIDPGQAVLFGFSGVGDNRRFRRDLSDFNLTGFQGYKDHFAFTEADIRELDSGRRQLGAQYLVCTEKDYVKIMDFDLRDIPLLYVRNVIKLDVDIAGLIPRDPAQS
ncbi:MAG: tetraacyldisaccharide 4'-kinase [Candidatus Aminicenantes bacterium]|nr:tetraacyldisaccharide 4'-kinase [Candidatus Aminicenantes bacterium]